MVYITLKSYLCHLQEKETRIPKQRQRKVPSLLQIAKATGITYANLHKLATGKSRGIKFDTADKIIKVMRDRGFEMQLADLIRFVDERGDHESYG